MKIYIINLPASTDRKAHMLEQLQKQGLTDFEFIDAVKPANPIQGCMKSHKKVWARIAEDNAPAIVLEDDAVLHDSFYHHLHNRWNGSPIIESCQVALIGYQIHGNPVYFNPFAHWRKAQTTADFNGAYGYIVNGKTGAKHLLKLSEGVIVHPDLMMQDMANEGKLSLYFMNLPLVQHGGFASTLNHNGAVKSDTGHKTQDAKQKPAVKSKIQNSKFKIPTQEHKNVKISLIHPSRGRAQKAQQTFDYWLKQASGKIAIEHLVSIDKSDSQLKQYKDLFPSSVVMVGNNTCVVEAANAAANNATGNILVYLSDDFKCPENWDLLLAEQFTGIKKPMLLQVADGINEAGTECLTIPVMNKQLYKKLGYFWHPAYKSMFVDNDLYHTCKNNGWLVAATALVFEHEHWVNKKAPVDETYKNSEANWKQGEKLFNKRKAQNFPL